jgi:4-amino-4-deoxy-L-arabinose transferase-like glycosyltransferase
MNEASSPLSRSGLGLPVPSRKRLAGLAVLLGLCGILFLHRLADRDLWSSHEARAAQDAQTILDDGAWGLPHLYHGEVELQKPPLYYWIVAVLAWCRGGAVDAWAVRLPAALAGLACVLALYGFGLLRGRPVAGWVAAAALATALHFTWLARVGRIDMPLTLTVTLALGGAYLARGAGRRAALPWLVLAYLALVVGVLLKGPIAAVLVAGPLGVHLLSEREVPAPWRPRAWARLMHRLGLWWGLPLVLVLASPWFLWANAQTGGELFRVFFWHHNIERGFDPAGGLKDHPWWFYGPQLALDFLPWSVLLPVAGGFLLRRGRWRADTEARFGLVWLLVVTALLSCARFKRADYLLPAFPGAALFLGCAAERWVQQIARPRRLAAAGGLALAGCLIGWAIYLNLVLPRGEARLEQRRFAAEVRRRAPAPRQVLLFWTEDHSLAFHLGRPLDILIQWEDLDAWAGRPETTYVIMPPRVAAEAPKYLKSGRLEPVLSNTELAGGRHDKPLLLLRTVPRGPAPESADARRSGTAPDQDRADQRAALGP